MTLDHTISIHINSEIGWSGNLLIKPGVYDNPPTLEAPGKESGDMRLRLPSDPSQSPQAFLSLGPSEKLTSETMRKAGGLLVKWLVKNKVKSAGISLTGLSGLSLTIEEGFNAFNEGLFLGAFQFNKHKSSVEEPHELNVDWLFAAEQKDQIDRLGDLLTRTSQLTAAVNLSRTWAHEPPNIINPITLAERIGGIASKEGLHFTVLDDRQLAEMGANAILSVGKGSNNPSRMIILEYAGQDTSEKPVVLVGKAITFDTGGYSLKERAGMVGMKYDKSAGMDVIAILVAAARLNLKTPLVGVIAAAENMISGEAYRPNDILVTLSGKTVEVISADAEGRLVLCDALTYAQRKYSPRVIIDLATLTGGVVVALGKLRAGIMSNNQALADALIQAGELTHERLWQLPLDDEYFELIKGDDSDFKNSGAREAHPIIGGIFLKQFVPDDTPWAHLDIAGVADAEKDLPYCPKGATGFGVRLLISYLEQLS